MVENVAPINSQQIGKDKLSREGITVEINQATPTGKSTVSKTEYAIEVTYQGSYELAEETLQDGTSKLLDENFNSLGSWIASTLVKLGDLNFAFHTAADS
jgi:hypothetical protein